MIELDLIFATFRNFDINIAESLEVFTKYVEI